MYSEYDYTRGANPTRTAFEQALAACENGNYGLAFSSGCAAMTCIMHIIKPGDHVLVCDDVYGGTNRYMQKFCRDRFGYDVELIKMTDADFVASKVTDKTALVWQETPTNPLLTINDIESLVKKIKAKNPNVLFVSDNTFATSYLQNPLDLGADIVLHSVSKYIGGHSDVIMGALAMKRKDLWDRLDFALKSFGGCPSVFDCYLALRGLKTLEARMKMHCKNAFVLAKWLDKHPQVKKVIYPGLESHPQHEIAKKQMRGFGGMISFYLDADLEGSKKFLAHLHTLTLAESLGGVETLIELPSVMTHASISKEEREVLGITDNMIRVSVGIEDVEDLITDMEKAFEAIKK